MKRALLVMCVLVFAACGKKDPVDPVAAAPPPATVEREPDSSVVKVDHPEQFPLATAEKHNATNDINTTGVVSPDVSRTVPVVSLASGKIIEINARLGDEVKKGQVLMKIRSSDIAQAFSDYRKAVVNEQLVKKQLDRAQTLFEKGAIAKKDLETAQNAEDTAKVDIDTTSERLRLLGSDLDHPTGIVEVAAPVSGIITDQQVTNASGVQGLSGPNPFTISDLSHVWIICDVYENDLSNVHMGEFADIRLNAYPGKVLRGRISNIGAILDPNIRTAKVRLEVENPGILRLGMFVTATFHGQTAVTRATVPAAAVLHLHDRDWVYVPIEGGQFRRTEVKSGNMLPGNVQEIISGIDPGTKVVSNALVLQNTAEQQ